MADRICMKACVCGGHPQVVQSGPMDYVGQCTKCTRRTRHWSMAIDVAEEWNAIQKMAQKGVKKKS